MSLSPVRSDSMYYYILLFRLFVLCHMTEKLVCRYVVCVADRKSVV